MGIKGSWSRVKDRAAYGANLEGIQRREKKRRAADLKKKTRRGCQSCVHARDHGGTKPCVECCELPDVLPDWEEA